MLKLLKIGIHVFFSLIINSLWAQDRPVYLSLRSHFGFIIPHASAIRPVSESHPWGIQGEISKLNISDRSWQKCHCYGRDGVSLSYFNFDDPRRLGYTIGGTYFAEGYLKPMGPFKVSVRGSVGVTYVSRIFDEQTNPMNKFFSSKLNFILGLTASFYYHISSDLALNFGLNYNHISNAGGKQPNKGMNFPTVSLGIDRTFRYADLSSKSDELRSFSKDVNLVIGSFGSLRSADEGKEKSKYPLIGLFTHILLPLSGINGVNVGVEASHDASYQERLERMGENNASGVFSVVGGHYFQFGSVYLLQQLGYYIAKPEKVQKRDFFQRYSVFYKMRKIGIGASLIAYGNVADHMDLRLAYFLR